MPEIGEIQRACDVGLSGETLMTWSACSMCGKTRWTPRVQGYKLCVPCAAKTRAREERPITYTGEGTPKIGDVTTAKILGLSGFMFMYYDPCVKCGTPRWVRKSGRGVHCYRCAPKNTEHRRDRKPDSRYGTSGYVYVYIEKDDPMRSMAKKDGWVLEHRLVVARRIGRPLTRLEVAHHINGVRHDNRESNLQLLTRETHHSYLGTYEKQNRIRDLERRVTLLEAENVILRKQSVDIANPEPSRESDLLGVCRDLTGDTLQYEGEEKVHTPRKLEDELCSKCGHRCSRLCSDRQPQDGASTEKSVDKLRVKRGNLLVSGSDTYGNPVPSLPKSGSSRQEGVETRDEDSSTNKSQQIPPSYMDEEIVHTSEKSPESSGNLLDITSRISLQGLIPAALEDKIKWRCLNPPKRGTLSPEKDTPIPCQAEGFPSEVRRDCTEGTSIV